MKIFDRLKIYVEIDFGTCFQKLNYGTQLGDEIGMVKTETNWNQSKKLVLVSHSRLYSYIVMIYIIESMTLLN